MNLKNIEKSNYYKNLMKSTKEIQILANKQKNNINEAIKDMNKIFEIYSHTKSEIKILSDVLENTKKEIKLTEIQESAKDMQDTLSKLGNEVLKMLGGFNDE
jgi:methyl-accepting chemotaxis protein